MVHEVHVCLPVICQTPDVLRTREQRRLSFVEPPVCEGGWALQEAPRALGALGEHTKAQLRSSIGHGCTCSCKTGVRLRQLACPRVV